MSIANIRKFLVAAAAAVGYAVAKHLVPAATTDWFGLVITVASGHSNAASN